jgi:hypothetical protein
MTFTVQVQPNLQAVRGRGPRGGVGQLDTTLVGVDVEVIKTPLGIFCMENH